MYTTEFSMMLLDMVDMVFKKYAWVSSHLKHKSQGVVLMFEKKISQVMEVEKEQGTSPLSKSMLSLHYKDVCCWHILFTE